MANEESVQHKLNALSDRKNPLQDQNMLRMAHTFWVLEQIRDGKKVPDEVIHALFEEPWAPHCILSNLGISLAERSVLCRRFLQAAREVVQAAAAKEDVEILVIRRPQTKRKEDG